MSVHRTRNLSAPRSAWLPVLAFLAAAGAAGCGQDIESRIRDDTDLRTHAGGRFGTTLAVAIEGVQTPEARDAVYERVESLLRGRAIWAAIVPAEDGADPEDVLTFRQTAAWTGWLWNFWDSRSGYCARYDFEAALASHGEPIVDGRVTGVSWDQQTAHVDLTDAVERRVEARALGSAAEKVCQRVLARYDDYVRTLATDVQRLARTDAPRLAFLGVVVSDVAPTDGPVFLRYLEGDLARAGVPLVERGALDEILAEQQLGLSGAVDPRTAARIGELAGAGLAAFGALSVEGGRTVAQITFVDTGSAEIVTAVRASWPTQELDRLATAAANLVVEEIEQLGR